MEKLQRLKGLRKKLDTKGIMVPQPESQVSGSHFHLALQINSSVKWGKYCDSKLNETKQIAQTVVSDDSGTVLNPLLSAKY